MQKGFTIIECLISILLLAIIMTGGMSFYFYSLRLGQYGTHKKIAAEIANIELERRRGAEYDSLNCGAPPEVEQISIGSLRNPYSTATKTVEVTCPEAGYKQVVVTISWNEGGKKDDAGNPVLTNVILTTLISQ